MVRSSGEEGEWRGGGGKEVGEDEVRCTLHRPLLLFVERTSLAAEVRRLEDEREASERGERERERQERGAGDKQQVTSPR